MLQFLNYVLYNDVLAFSIALFFTICLIWSILKVLTFVISNSIVGKPYKSGLLLLLFLLATLLWTWFYYAQLCSPI